MSRCSTLAGDFSVTQTDRCASEPLSSVVFGLLVSVVDDRVCRCAVLFLPRPNGRTTCFLAVKKSSAFHIGKVFVDFVAALRIFGTAADIAQ